VRDDRQEAVQAVVRDVDMIAFFGEHLGDKRDDRDLVVHDENGACREGKLPA
jgi:hypothetical protein